MSRIRTIIRKVAAGAPAAGFIASVVKAAVQFSNRFTLLASEVKAAVAVEATRHSMRTPQTPAIAVSRVGVVGAVMLPLSPAGSVVASLRDVARIAQKPALVVTQSLRAWAGTVQKPALVVSRLGVAGSSRKDVMPAIDLGAVLRDFKVPQTPAANLAQVVYSLVQNKGANSVVEEANPRTDWASDANATGQHDGANATFAGNTLGARSGKLVLSYAAPVNKTALTITKVELHFYIAQQPPLLGAGALTLSYRISGGGDVLLEALTGTNQQEDNLTTPRIYDITSAVGGSWTTLATVKAVVAASTGITNTGTAQCDAVEVHVEATLTEAL